MVWRGCLSVAGRSLWTRKCANAREVIWPLKQNHGSDKCTSYTLTQINQQMPFSLFLSCFSSFSFPPFFRSVHRSLSLSTGLCCTVFSFGEPFSFDSALAKQDDAAAGDSVGKWSEITLAPIYDR